MKRNLSSITARVTISALFLITGFALLLVAANINILAGRPARDLKKESANGIISNTDVITAKTQVGTTLP